MTSFYYSIVTLQSKSGIPKVKINATLGKYWPSSGYKVVNKLLLLIFLTQLYQIATYKTLTTPYLKI